MFYISALNNISTLVERAMIVKTVHESASVTNYTKVIKCRGADHSMLRGANNPFYTFFT